MFLLSDSDMDHHMDHHMVIYNIEAVQILRHNFIEETATFSQQQENYGEILSKNHQIEAFVEIF